ncbi:MAG TPA: lysylphosphatidylglycerol synthase domain-containing protein, partial [Anaerolineaceae bacterium]|nr:lysylphosphatidylglycerol synthase domain-containing protein [Anaerolineaceae bacterium]
AAFAAAAAGVVLFLRRKQDISRWLANGLVRLSPGAYKEVVRNNAERLATRVVEFDRKFIATILLISLGNYFLLLMRVFAIIQAVHIVMPFWYFTMAVPLLRLVGLLPISVLGIGTRDVTSIYLYGQVGVPATSALVSSTLGLLTLQVQTVIGLIVSWRYPLQSRAEAAPAPEAPVRD